MSTDIVLFLIGLGELALWSPILTAIYLAAFRGRGVRGRWLFVLVGPVAAYTILWVATIVFVVPAYVLLIFFAPGIKQLVNQMPYWYPIAEFVAKYELLLAAGACGLLSVWLVTYLWPRWVALLAVVISRPDGPSNR